jgi:hypothetical protein
MPCGDEAAFLKGIKNCGGACEESVGEGKVGLTKILLPVGCLLRFF